jgi:hypothetical protein
MRGNAARSATEMRLRTNKPLPIPPFLFKNEGFTGEIMKRSDPISFLTTATVAFAVLLTLAPSRVSAQEGTTVAVDAVISIGGQTFSTWNDYYTSQYFQDSGKRCGKPATTTQLRAVDPSDCTFSFTNPSSDYVPGAVYEIPVVVHIIEHSNGNGQISDALVHSQIDVLNEDFRALTGTPGAGGYDAAIQFVLASTDPGGSPTTGITRTVDNNWYNDTGNYWDTLAWDTAEYMNIYTNTAGGNLGYVPDLPQSGLAGSNEDRVVILWSAFGRNSSGGPPYDQGRTVTHEVGHYLGLEHTFNGGCAAASSPACYSSGDLICDTNSEDAPTFGCPVSATSCGTSDPIENYMDYSDDTCMELFSMEQSLRMRCSLLNYRADLWNPAVPPVCGNSITESGEDCDGTDDAMCPGLCQIDCMCPLPICGNNIIEFDEECDGTSTGSCPTGTCDVGCVCPAPVCGNDIVEAGEHCDGTEDSACPALCQAGCTCPSIDECIHALVISEVPFSDSRDTTSATISVDDPDLSCGFGGQQDHSVWYEFTAPADGIVTADTFGSDYDTVLAALTGECGALVQIDGACNDDASGFQSQIMFNATAGVTYYLEVTSFVGDAGGNLVFSVDLDDRTSLCGAAPETVCLDAAQAKLDYNENVLGKEKMKLQWKKITTATLQSDFGNPTSGVMNVALCIYDDADTLVRDFVVERAGAICGGGKACWRSKGTKGYSYKDSANSADGVAKMGYSSGAVTRGKADAKGKNNPTKGQASLPTGVVADLTTNVTPTIQMITSDGFCVSATMTQVKKDQNNQYKAQKK